MTTQVSEKVGRDPHRQEGPALKRGEERRVLTMISLRFHGRKLRGFSLLFP